MSFRTTTSGPRSSLPIVADRWEDRRPRPRVLATLGRLDHLQQTGQLEALSVSGARRAQAVLRLSAHAKGQLPTVTTRRLGPAPIFPRPWQQTGCPRASEPLRHGRRFEGAVVRALVLTVLHRRFAPGRDRAADQGRTGSQSDGGAALPLPHLDRVRAGLGEEWPRGPRPRTTPFAPRGLTDRSDEEVFAPRRDLVTDPRPVFFDTPSIAFEGHGRDDLGPRGVRKDHRPDLDPRVVGAVLEGPGRPIGGELGPGNPTDGTTLLPVGDRLRSRFGVRRVGLGADRGLIRQETIEASAQDERGGPDILGARRRSPDAVNDEVLSRAGRSRVVHPRRVQSDDPSPVKLKEVGVGERRYVVGRNEEAARPEAAARATLGTAPREQLRSGDQARVGPRGDRRPLSGGDSPHFRSDEAKVAEDARSDGRWVLRTNTDLDSSEGALPYKRWGMVEPWFRSCKTWLPTRPISHRCDETIRGPVSCSFRARVLRPELQSRREERGHEFEWADGIGDQDGVPAVAVDQDGNRFLVRSAAQGPWGKVFQAVGVALPPTVEEVSPTTPGEDAAPRATPPD